VRGSRQGAPGWEAGLDRQPWHDRGELGWRGSQWGRDSRSQTDDTVDDGPIDTCPGPAVNPLSPSPTLGGWAEGLNAMVGRRSRPLPMLHILISKPLHLCPID
jgi:hypothetical protein